MTTPWKLITRKSDPWIVKAKKKLARRLWDDLTRSQDPPVEEVPRKLLASFDIRDNFKDELRKVRKETGREEP